MTGDLPWPYQCIHRYAYLYAILFFLGPHIDSAIAAAPEMKGGYR
jgi:hypothetical protein